MPEYLLASDRLGAGYSEGCQIIARTARFTRREPETSQLYQSRALIVNRLFHILGGVTAEPVVWIFAGVYEQSFTNNHTPAYEGGQAWHPFHSRSCVLVRG